MALPTAADLKTYLRIQTAAEDTLLALLVTRATAAVEGYVGRPLATSARTFRDTATSTRRGEVTRLLVPLMPIAAEPAPVVTDNDDVVVPVAQYRVDPELGLLDARPGYAFGNPPYTIAATVGLGAMPDYATRVEPVLALAILDVAADLYQRRNPGAQAEGAGGGVYTQWRGDGIPQRVADDLAPFRLVAGV